MMNNIINKIQEHYENLHGYKPSVMELYDMFLQGELSFLTDTAENALLEVYERELEQ